MARIEFDAIGERYFETGVKNAVLFPYNAKQSKYGKGVAWNGITGVTESPSGAEATPLYADNIKYLNLYSAEDFGATIECYTYPKEWEQCDGSAEIADGVIAGQQARTTFGLVYRTEVGNDVNDRLGYKIHVLYGCKAQPSEKAFATINDSPEAITFSYTVTTTPVKVAGFEPTAIITIDSRKVDEDDLKEFENLIYGTDTAGEVQGTDPTFPMPEKILEIFGKANG